MGTGDYGHYKYTNGSSQIESDYYHVVKEELEKDRKDSDIYNIVNGYFQNPKSISLKNAIKNDIIYLDNNKVHGIYTYVLDTKDNIIFGKRYNPNNILKRSPHPTLLGGKDPIVQCAGMITFINGKIVSVDNKSGHFRPHINSLNKVNDILTNLYNENPKIFSNKSKWGNKNEK